MAIEALAEEFVARVPEEEFIPAKIRSFLLEHKHLPEVAVNRVQEWETKQITNVTKCRAVHRSWPCKY